MGAGAGDTVPTNPQREDAGGGDAKRMRTNEAVFLAMCSGHSESPMRGADDGRPGRVRSLARPHVSGHRPAPTYPPTKGDVKVGLHGPQGLRLGCASTEGWRRGRCPRLGRVRSARDGKSCAWRPPVARSKGADSEST